MLKQIALAAAVVVSLPALAINKCIGPDGKAVFQDAPCAGAGGAIEVKPASGGAPSVQPAQAAAAAGAGQAAKRGEGAFGEKWRRRTDLESHLIANTRAEIDAHQRRCVAQQAELAAKKGRANNNLAGATWEQSISAEMQAAATLCDTRARELRSQLESQERELRELKAAGV